MVRFATAALSSGHLDLTDMPTTLVLGSAPEVTVAWANDIKQIVKTTTADSPFGGIIDKNGQRNGLRFTGTDEDIVLDAWDHPEFCEWKWVDPELLPELIVPFKRDMYRDILDGFADHIGPVANAPAAR